VKLRARPSSRLIFVGAATVAAGFFLACGDEPHTTYFVHGSGELRVTGGQMAVLPLRAGSVPFGAARLAPRTPRRLAFDFNAGAGTFTFSLDEFVGAGAYSAVRDVVLGLNDVAYLCRAASPCTDCTVTVREASNTAIAGDVVCTSLIDCPSDPVPRELPVGACRGSAVSTIDVSGSFRVDDPRNKPLDY
jgi:hypothetical protein